MTREQLLQLEELLEEMYRSYGDELSNDRFTALHITKETVCSIILNQNVKLKGAQI